MHPKNKRNIGIAILLFVCACQHIDPIYIDEPSGAKPTNAEKQIREYLRQSLRDPDSLKQFKVSEPYNSKCNSMGHYLNRWVVPFEYNAKNGYGGYTGLSVNYAFFKDGNLISTSSNSMYCS